MQLEFKSKNVHNYFGFLRRMQKVKGVTEWNYFQLLQSSSVCNKR